MEKKNTSKDIAIISMACRFPDAENIEQFWENLIKGTSSIKEIPEDRWSLEGFYSPEGEPAKSNSKYGSFLTDIKSFDAEFFRINEADARIMDPQQRLLIELAYETIMSSKYRLETLKGKKVGVFLGITKTDYREHVQAALLNGEVNQSTIVIGVLRNLIPARISNLFDFQGPSLTIDTACSSSLVALQTAKESILNGTSELALVGGINLNITTVPYLGMSMAGALTSSDKYHVFDEKSNGFIMGEGGGLVLLKKLEDAIKDHDVILGVIKGSSVNNDGKSISPMAPRPITQQMVLHEAYEDAGMSPNIVDYLEAHGTGTALGDAIEAQTIIKTFGSKTVVGSVKPNIGHLLSGAGIAGLIKALLIIKNRVIPPLVNYENPRKELKLEENGFVLNKSALTIETDKPITIGINAFGFGGTNAHIVLQEFKSPTNAINSFKQFTPKYHKKEHWVALKKVLKLTESKIPCYISKFTSKTINNTEFLPSEIYISASYEKQDLVHKLVRNSNYHELSAKVIFDLDSISKDNSTLILIEPSYQELLEKMQALAKNNVINKINKILVLTENSLMVEKEDTTKEVSNFITSGLTFALASEFPSIQVTQIDFEANTINDLKIRKLIEEVKNSFHESIIAYRKETRLVLSIEELIDKKENLELKKAGVYLVTGITGIISEIIKKLSEKEVNLVVCSRREAEAIKEWESLKKYVEKNNSSIELIKTDLTQSSEVENLFTQIQEKYKKLDGVIHGAGIVSPAMFENKSLAEFEKVLAPKVTGIQLIDEFITKYNFKPDFVVSFSSLSSTVQGLSRGISDYATANFFLDQFSKLMRNQGKNFSVINWGPWEEKGMAANPLLLKKLAEDGIQAISLVEGSKTFEKLLKINLEQVIAVKADKKSLVYKPKEKTTIVVKNTTVKSLEVKKETIKVNFSNTSLHDFLITLVQEELSEQSKKDTITIDSNLLDLGIDSLSAIEMSKKLQEAGFKDIPFELFFEHQTIRSIANFLLKDKDTLELNNTNDEEVETETSFSLSPLQNAFYMSHAISEVPSFSFQRQVIKGKIDLSLLEKSVHLLLKKHLQLRANFITEKHKLLNSETVANVPYNVVQKISPYENYEKINIIKVKQQDHDITVIENNFVNTNFDLAKDLLFKLLVVESKTETNLLILMHHIIFDGVSMKIFSEELWSNYYALLKKQELKETSLTTTYFDYIKFLNTKTSKDSIKYWETKISEYEIDLGKEKNKFLNFEEKITSSAYSSVIEKGLNEKILAFCQNEQIPLQVFYLLAYFKTLAQWLNSENIAINIAVSGRELPLPEINKVIGCFADTYPLYYQPNLTLSELRTELQELRKYQSIGSNEITKIFKKLAKNYSPFAFSFAIFDKSWAEKLVDIDFIKTNMRGFNINTKFALTFWEDFSGINYTINYPEKLLTLEELNNFEKLFKANLSSLLNNFSKSGEQSEFLKYGTFSTVPFNENDFNLNPKQEITLKKESIKTSIKANNKNLVLEKIIAVAKANPDKPAIIYQDKVITYEALRVKSALIAGSLLQKGLNANNTIGIIGEPSINTIIALLGILRIGATWLPIDHNYPLARINKMKEVSQTDFVINTLENELIDNSYNFKYLLEEDFMADFVTNINPEKNAYIIFTSGSTGEPKGVPISYKAMENYLIWCNETFDYQASDNFVQTASISFDASVRQMLAPLLCGGTIYPLEKTTKLNAKELFRFVQKNDISVWSSVPSLWAVFVQVAETLTFKELPKLRMVKVGGEILTPSLVKNTQKLFPEAKIVNLYGPTETTINATYHLIENKLAEEIKVIPIGKPAANLTCSIHNSDGTFSSKNEVGELFVSGIGVTSGYLNSVELNQQKFYIDENNTRYYRTGDLVSLNDKYEYIFHGRVDRQVKIRGFRIELGEIENILLSHEAIEKAVVKVETTGILIAFVESKTLTEEVLKAYLIKNLPEYAIPNKIVILSEFPLLANGKTDINNLKETMVESTENSTLTNTETKIAEIWNKILNTNTLKSNANFFKLGGDSILIMQMFIELEKSFDSLPKIASFYKNGTLSYLASLIDNLQDNKTTDRKEVKALTDKFYLSPSQKGFFLVNKFTQEKDSSWKAIFCLKGEINLTNFQKALNLVMERHELLQVNLINEIVPYFKRLKDNKSFPFTFEEKATDINELLAELGKEEINLSEWPLIKLKLVKLAEKEYLLAIHSHHVLADALSFLLLTKELFELYSSLEKNEVLKLMPLKNQFSDYVDLVTKDLELEKENSLNYWKDIFKETYKKPNLLNNKSENTTHKIIKDKNTYETLKVIASNIGTTPFVLLLNLFYQTISSYSKQKDLVLGIAHHGRDYQLEDINKIFGCFTRAIPIRVKAKNTLLEQIELLDKNVKESSSFIFNPIDLLKEKPSATDFHSLLGTQFFLTYIDITANENEGLLKIDWEKSYSDFEPSNLNTDIFLTIKRATEHLILSFNFKGFDSTKKDTFITLFNNNLENLLALANPKEEHLKFQKEPLSIENFGTLDSALIGYLPSKKVLKNLGISEALFKNILFKNEKALWLEGIKTPYGNTAFITMPFFAEEINLGNSKVIIEHLLDAIKYAETLGIKYVSLAGMLPAITDYGNIFSAITKPIITTGHSTTVSAVVKNTLNAIEKLKLSVKDSTIAFIGLGSIGKASLLALFKKLEAPKKVILCDIYGSEKRLEELETILKVEFGYQGVVEKQLSNMHLNEAVYFADIMVCAVSSIDILEIDKLKPNCLVVDDSFPHCFDVNKAIKRMEEKKDIYVIGGGLLYLGTIERTIYLPIESEVIKDLLNKNLIEGAIPSCQAESLLMNQNTLPITKGLVDYQQVSKYLELIEALGIMTPKMHLSTYLLEEKQV